MLDLAARKALSEANKGKQFSEGIFNGISEAINLKKENQTLMEEVIKKDSLLAENMDKIGKALSLIYRTIPGKTLLPKIFNIQGKVEVTNPTPIDGVIKQLQDIRAQIEELKRKKFPTNFVVDNFLELEDYFQSLEKRISDLATAISSMPKQKAVAPKIEIPAFPKIEIPKTDNTQVVKAIQKLGQELTEKLNSLPQSEPVSFARAESFLETLANKPTYTPQPVTNININALQGFAESTNDTVTTTRTPLPSYGQLFNRRSLIIFNNSSDTTLYIGGQDVTSTNGLPVLAQSYSPAIDAGYNLIVYGIVASGSANVRTFEISKDKENNVQQ